MTTLKKTTRSRVRRLPKRGHYDFDTVAAIIDAGFICHIGYLVDGKPIVTPTAYWREGDRVVWHGSHASRALAAQGAGGEVCLTVTHVDGLVLARSGFHHSINYRSVMLFGKAMAIDDPAEKLRSLEAFVERMFPGRWPTLRPVTRKELAATHVYWIAIDEGSAKVRSGPPIDDEDDYALPIWAGVLPIEQRIGKAIPDPRLMQDIPLPAYLRKLALWGK